MGSPVLSPGKMRSRAVPFQSLPGLGGFVEGLCVCDKAPILVSVFTAPTTSGTEAQPLARTGQQDIVAVFLE